MTFTLFLLSLLSAGDGGAPGRPAEVTGLLATRVRFSGAAGDRVAEAGLNLLASCSYSQQPNEGELPRWDDTLLDTLGKCHIRLRFPEPRAVNVMTRSLEVSEMLIALPLNTGSIWIRSGDRAARFAKWDSARARRLQETLDAAETSE